MSLAPSDTMLRRDRRGLAAPVAAQIFEGRVARVHPVGDPLRYPWGNEHRDAEELAKMVAQLAGKPVVLIHPKDGKRVSDGSSRATVVGRIMSARVDGEYAIAQFAIHDAEALAAIAGGRGIGEPIRELSLGYDVGRRDENGFQRDITIDHLALVPRARCGATCALRADDSSSACACSGEGAGHEARVGEEPATEDESPAEPCTCKTRAIGYGDQGMADKPNSDASGAGDQKGIVMDELQKNLAAAMTEAAAQKARADQAENDLTAARARADQAEADKTKAEIAADNARKDVGVEKARADQVEIAAKASIEKSRQDADEAFGARVDARVALLAVAAPIVGKDDKGQVVDLSKMSDLAIKIAVIKRVDGDVPEGKPAPYYDGVYDGALGRHARVQDSVTTVRTTVVKNRVDAASNPNRLRGRSAEDAARAAMNADATSASRKS